MRRDDLHGSISGKQRADLSREVTSTSSCPTVSTYYRAEFQGRGWVVVGYARVGTDRQQLLAQTDAQTDALTAAGCERIYTDRLSSVRQDRPRLAALLDQVRVGDTVVVALDWLGRSLRRASTPQPRPTGCWPRSSLRWPRCCWGCVRSRTRAAIRGRSRRGYCGGGPRGRNGPASGWGDAPTGAGVLRPGSGGLATR